MAMLDTLNARRHHLNAEAHALRAQAEALHAEANLLDAQAVEVADDIEQYKRAEES